MPVSPCPEDHQPDFEPQDRESVEHSSAQSSDIQEILVRFFNTKMGETTYCVEDQQTGNRLMQLDGREGAFVVRNLNEKEVIYNGGNLFKAAYQVLQGGRLTN